MRYEYLEHTADAKFRAYGKTLEEAFANAALALFNIITDTSKVKRRVLKKIKLRAETKEALLYDFLDRLVFLVDAEEFLLCDVKKIKIEGNALDAELYGDTISRGYETRTAVKAVTYNEMEIKKNREWVVQVVVDL